MILITSEFVKFKLQNLTERCSQLKKKQINPKLCVILAGNNPASLSYVKKKIELTKQIGADSELIHLDENINLEDFLKIIDLKNKDHTINGILIQLPLALHLNLCSVKDIINPIKDIDCFHQNNYAQIYDHNDLKKNRIRPCTPGGIIDFLNWNKFPFEGSLALVIGRSNLVGKPLVHFLNEQNATVIWCHSKTKNLVELTKLADLIVSATGTPKLITKDHLNSKKTQYVIDVGTSKVNSKICGDVDPSLLIMDDLKNTHITPVPGGVGPLTVTTLMENLISMCEFSC